MQPFDRNDYEARYELFDQFTLNDQKRYYQKSIKKSRIARRQVGQLAATFTLLAGLAAAASGLLVSSDLPTQTQVFADQDTLRWIVLICIGVSIVFPAISAFFTSLSDLYQWDRTIELYETALENIEVADAQSPLPEMTDEMFLASLRAYSEGTLQVMDDETAQWGQSIGTPEAIEKFLEEARAREGELFAQKGADETSSDEEG